MSSFAKAQRKKGTKSTSRPLSARGDETQQSEPHLDIKQRNAAKEKKNSFRTEKKVCTPDWNKDIPNSPQSSVEFFNILKKHRRIEILEIRIHDGIDCEHVDADVTPEIEKEKDNIQETPYEMEQTKHYREQQERLIVPSFWPTRIWDKDENRLNEEQTMILSDNIKYAVKNSHQFLKERDRKILSFEQKKPRKKKLPLVYSYLDYETDPSDDITDWDDVDIFIGNM